MTNEPERAYALIWMIGWSLIGLCLAGFCLPLAWPLAQLGDAWILEDGRWVTGARIDWWSDAWHSVLDFWHYPKAWLGIYKARFLDLPMQHHGIFPVDPVILIVLFPGLLVVLAVGCGANPFSFAYQAHGSARWMTRRDLYRNRLLCSTGLVLGMLEPSYGEKFVEWLTSRNKAGRRQPSPYFRPKLVRNKEVLCELLIAPPGTGKTVMLNANLLADNPDRPGSMPGAFMGPSFVVNDPKAEIFMTTSGYRRTLGPVFKLAWADADGHRYNPLGPENLPGGIRPRLLHRAIRQALGEIYGGPGKAVQAFNQAMKMIQNLPVTWRDDILRNPRVLAPFDQVMPTDAAVLLRPLLDGITEYFKYESDRYMAYSRISSTAIPDSVETHWRITGRAALNGMMGFTVARCERFPEKYGQPSFAKLIDWLTGTEFDGSVGIDTSNGAGYDGVIRTESAGVGASGENLGAITKVTNLGSGPADATGGAADDDKTKQLLERAIEEACLHGYPDTVVKDLRELLMKPDKERGSVISTAAGAISIFKNPAVRARTSDSDFCATDLRGIFNPETKRWEPVTVYVIVPVSDAESLGRVTGMMIEGIASVLLSQPDDVVKKGRATGRVRPVTFLFDEFWTLPQISSIKDIPALGRGLWVNMILVGQSFGQLKAKYRGEGDGIVSTLQSSCSYKVIPTQNDQETAKKMSEAVGNYTMREVRRTSSKGGGSTSVDYKSMPLIRPEDVTSMEKLDPEKNHWGWQMVQVVGLNKYPIKCRPVAWFRIKSMADRASLGPARIEDYGARREASTVEDQRLSAPPQKAESRPPLFKRPEREAA